MNPKSNTETFVAMKLEVENWRWAEVPFYIRSGKRLAAHTTQIVIGFRRAPLLLFGEDVQSNITPNLVIHVQPDEGITLDIHAKRPGPHIYLANVPLQFSYSDFGELNAATGYETLLYDCMVGDPTLFHRYDSVDASWRIVNPILDVWQALPARDFPNYDAGTWGPEAADHLIEKNGHKWHHYLLNPRRLYSACGPEGPTPPHAVIRTSNVNQPETILAGDIGTKATNIFSIVDDARHRAQPSLPSSAYPSLNAIIGEFLKDEKVTFWAMLWRAGTKNRVARPTNLKWGVNAAQSEQSFPSPG